MTSEAAQQPIPLYPQLDEAALRAFVAALQSGDTSGLAPARAAEVDQARSLLTFAPVEVQGAADPATGEPTRLDAGLWRHTGPEPRAVVVMPSPWTDLGWLSYAVQATAFAAKGYNVLAYTARGFGRSGGEVDVAGPLDVQDGTLALDFLIERTPSGVTAAGFLGDSYGSGISQLVAAHDTRVDAVVAMSTWGDLGEAFYENTTRHVAAVTALLNAARNARLSRETAAVFADVLNNRNIEATLAWAARRSPLTYVDELRERGMPVYFAHAWHETLFPVNQTLRMFEALTGPKRLDLSIGDHSCPEMSGIIGLPNRIWSNAHRWLDQHLRGEDTGIGAEGQILSQVMWNKTLEDRPTWTAVTTRRQRVYLTGGAAGGSLADKPETGWTIEALTGIDTPATVADAIITTGYDELAGRPKTYPADGISRDVAAVWTGAPQDAVLRLRGIPRLRLSCAAATPRATFVAYLLDVAPDGTGHIVTHAPFTRLQGDPESPYTAEVELQATAYDVPAGHRLMLVADTVDPFYGGVNLPRGTLRFGSSDEDPAFLELPLG
ncbi:CocE/NonD family hydrolase [Streptomyces sp. NPDC101132]|uniref:CocE/NonD family hydrolase n=1 Tax=Streptomyces sp. NPDC101132 TaxID=3366110 RepID=UPI00381CAD6C